MNPYSFFIFQVIFKFSGAEGNYFCEIDKVLMTDILTHKLSTFKQLFQDRERIVGFFENRKINKTEHLLKSQFFWATSF